MWSVLACLVGLAQALEIRAPMSAAGLPAAKAVSVVSIPAFIGAGIPVVAVRPTPSIPALSRLSSIAAPIAAAGSGPRERDFAAEFDGVEERELAAVERRAQKREHAVMHAQRPVVDYRRSAYSDATARELADAVVEFPGGAARTGRQLLEIIVTPYAVDPEIAPDLTRVDPAVFGLSDSEVRAAVDREKLVHHVYSDFLMQAFHFGLIYRLNDDGRRKTYYGVPAHVRAALGLMARSNAEVERQPVGTATASPLAAALAALAREAQALPPKDELFEFAAQAVEAALKAGEVDAAAIAPGFLERARLIGFSPGNLGDALIVLAQSSYGTPWFDKVASLCELAVERGLLTRRDLDEALEGLR